MKVSVAALKKFFGRDLSETDAVAMRAVLAAVNVNDGRSVQSALETADRLIGAHGVEAIRGKYVDRYYGDIVAEYYTLATRTPERCSSTR